MPKRPFACTSETQFNRDKDRAENSACVSCPANANAIADYPAAPPPLPGGADSRRDLQRPEESVNGVRHASKPSRRPVHDDAHYSTHLYPGFPWHFRVLRQPALRHALLLARSTCDRLPRAQLACRTKTTP